MELRAVLLLAILIFTCVPSRTQACADDCAKPDEGEKVVANGVMPLCSADYREVCTGTCNEGFTGSPFYKCELVGESYLWSDVIGECIEVISPTGSTGSTGGSYEGTEASVSSAISPEAGPGRYLLQGGVRRMSLPATLRIEGQPAIVAPFAITGTNWPGHDATDVATCMSGALVSLSNVNALMSPDAPPDLTDLQNRVQQEAASGVADVLSLTTAGGSMYASSMYKGAARSSAKQLKAELTKHYGSLIKVPGCLEMPTYMVQAANNFLANFMSTHGGIANSGPRGVSKPSPEVLLEVTAVVKDVQSLHPELCEGIKGKDIRAQFVTSLSDGAQSPTSMWFYMAVNDQGCDVTTT